MRKREPETKADHLACFNMHMQRHAQAFVNAYFAVNIDAITCYQLEQAYHFAQADYHRECWKVAPTERSGWRPY